MISAEVWQLFGLVALLAGAFIKFYTDTAKRFSKLETEMNTIIDQNKLLFSKLDKMQNGMSDLKVQIAKIETHDR